MLSQPAQDVNELVADMEARRPLVAAHCRRVAAYASGWPPTTACPSPTIETIRVGGLLHDIGKVMVPSQILSKPGRLTEAASGGSSRPTPKHGFDMVEPLGFDSDVLDIILYHHERTDSSGYPDGLDGDSIPWPSASSASWTRSTR